MSERVHLVLCPVPDAVQALELARRVVEEGLAACGQTLTTPITSVYRWEGELCEDTEVLLLLKTSGAAWPRLRDRIAQLHPYEIPEILALPADGNEAYLRWVEESCRPRGTQDGEREDRLGP